jgi:3-oxoadipate enol-lactonase
MTEMSEIETGPWHGFERRAIQGAAGALSFRISARGAAGTVLFNHSILTGSAIWHRQSVRLAGAGWTVICLDTRGHGDSPASPAPYAMNDLVDDNIALLNALAIDQVHFVGVSQGGMTGLGLGIRHCDRLQSLCVCAARADAPTPFAAMWDERIAFARENGLAALAKPTIERWFGTQLFQEKPEVTRRLLGCIEQTSVEGFVGCARAIQGLDYIKELSKISVRTSLIVGSRDDALRGPMRELAGFIDRADFTEIQNAGHLPQIDQPDLFDAILDRHLAG